MPVTPPPSFRSLPSLAQAVLVVGACCGAPRLGPTGVVLIALMGVLALLLHRDASYAWALPAGPWKQRDGLPELVLARVTPKEGSTPPGSPRSTGAPELSEQRPLWSWVKIWFGGVGLSLCGLWWLLLVALLFLPDPSPMLDGLFTNSSLTLLTVSLLVSVFFLVVFRSGLRGPSDPLAPESEPSGLRDLPLDPGGGGGDGGDPVPPPSPSPDKKPRLRLVRPNP